MMFCSGFVEGSSQRTESVLHQDDEDSSSGDSDIDEASLAETSQTSTICDDSGDEDEFTSSEPTMHSWTAAPDDNVSKVIEGDVRRTDPGGLTPEDPSLDCRRNVNALSTMRSVSTSLPADTRGSPRQTFQVASGQSSSTPVIGRQYTDILIRDISYSTYKALLYYLYTDHLHFAPLSSIYTYNRDTAVLQGIPVSE